MVSFIHVTCYMFIHIYIYIYREVTDKFQNQLEKDKKDIKRTDKLIIPADKTTNFYKMDNNEYRLLLETNVTKGYKKLQSQPRKTSQQQTKQLLQNLN